MREVILQDSRKEMMILMCEKHYQAYKTKLMQAMEAGTSFHQIKTNRKSCEYCGVDNEQC